MSDPRRFAATPFAAAHKAPEGLTATVLRELVHRASPAETFLTGMAGEEPGRFTVFAEWPRAHQLHVSPDRSAYEPLLVAETARQAGNLLAHTAYDVPLDHQFVLKEVRNSALTERSAVGATPAEPVPDLTVTDVAQRGARPAGLPPGVVDRALPADVVLAPCGRSGRRRLRFDTAHAVFFDHPLDHVPGMLLLKAARQAVRARSSDGRRTPVSFHAVFHRYTELDLPAWIEAFDGTGALGADMQVLGRQGEMTVFECEVGTVDG